MDTQGYDSNAAAAEHSQFDPYQIPVGAVLDFDGQRAKPFAMCGASHDEEKALLDAEAQLLCLRAQKEKDAEERLERESEEKSGVEQCEAQRAAEEKAQREAEEKAQCAAQVKAQREAQEKAQAQREAEEKARREVEENAQREVVEKAQREAQEKAQLEAEEKARLDDERQQELRRVALREASEKARLEVERQELLLREAQKRAEAQREAEEKAQREAQEKARCQAEEKAQAQREAQEKAHREAEEKAQREAREKAQCEAEEKAQREAEEKAQREAEEKARTLFAINQPLAKELVNSAEDHIKQCSSTEPDDFALLMLLRTEWPIWWLAHSVFQHLYPAPSRTPSLPPSTPIEKRPPVSSCWELSSEGPKLCPLSQEDFVQVNDWHVLNDKRLQERGLESSQLLQLFREGRPLRRTSSSGAEVCEVRLNG
eukprot:g14135.t1